MAKIKDKERMLKSVKENTLLHMRLSGEFSAKTLQARREWHNIFKIMKEMNQKTNKILHGKAIIHI